MFHPAPIHIYNYRLSGERNQAHHPLFYKNLHELQKTSCVLCFLKIHSDQGTDMNTETRQAITVVTVELPAEPSLLKSSHRVYSEHDNAVALIEYFDQCTRICYMVSQRVQALVASGEAVLFIPYINESQWIETLGGLDSADVILVEMLNPCLRDFNATKLKVWDRYGKLLLEEEYRPMVMANPGMVYSMFSSTNARNPQAQSAQPRNFTNPDDRYEQLVELINQNLSINEIAARMNLSAPSIYLMRTQYREQLKKDTTPGMRAMRFHKKDR